MTSNTIVILGLSSSGVAVLQSLMKQIPEEYRIVGINSQDFAYYPVAALRASVVKGWESKVVAPLTGLVPSSSSSKHVVLGGCRVTEIDFESKVVKLDHSRVEIGGSDQVHYDYLVVATGTDYGIPCRPPVGVTKMKDATSYLQKLQTDIESSQNILIVGAGPVGIEMSGEISSHYGKGTKNITLVSSSSTLFPQPIWKEGFRNSLSKSLREVGVDVILGARAKVDGLQTGPLPAGTQVTIVREDGREEEHEADFLVVAIGNTPNTSLFPPSLLAPSKRLRTDEFLGIPGCDGAYALGDVIDVDTKMMAAISAQANVVSKSIVAAIHGRSSTTKHKDFPTLMMVPVGVGHGAGQLFGMVVGAFMTTQIKGKGLFAGAWLKNYPAEYPTKKGWF